MARNRAAWIISGRYPVEPAAATNPVQATFVSSFLLRSGDRYPYPNA
jgi:hypothetical protein